MNNITQTIKILILATVLSFGLSYVYAWTAPAQTPPNGNVSAPLNTSATSQVKIGGLTVDVATSTVFMDANDGTFFLNPNGDSKLNNIFAVGDVCIFGTTKCLSAAGGAVSHGKQRFTTSGNWVAPAGVTTVWVTASGGGGGGGAGNLSLNAIGGGGGGGAASVVAEQLTVTPLTNYTITVGSGGAPGTAGTASSFGSLLTVSGGGAGQGGGGGYAGGSAGGPGGSAGLYGGPVSTAPPARGTGGGSIFGLGGFYDVATLGAAGTPGRGYGGGGSGGFGGSGYGANPGSSGFVLVEW